MTEKASKAVCIVTPDLLGFVRNGGIGTACAFLAEELARAGHRVTVFYAQGHCPQGLSLSWQDHYASLGISIVVGQDVVGDLPGQVFPNHPPLAMAWKVYAWLLRHEFDVTFFMEWQGTGFYALNAKRAGLGFEHCEFVTQVHSPSLWHAVHNAQASASPMDSLTYFMERKSVELADAVVSPSQYMLDWVSQHGFELPTRQCVLPNLLRLPDSLAPRQMRQSRKVRELVFFGRLEYRKGVVQFCDAIDCLIGQGVMPDKVVFLGKFSTVEQEHAGSYISGRMLRWSFPVAIHARCEHAQALAYLATPGRLAVMPSVAENSPYTVYECLALGTPFLARDVGGIAELIDARDHAQVLFSDNPKELAALLSKAIVSGVRSARAAFDVDVLQTDWLAFVDSLGRRRPRSKRTLGKKTFPKISVCLVHYQRPHLLRQAVASLLAQDYANFEVILVDDGSSDNASLECLDDLAQVFEQRSWRVIRQENAFLGRARNVAASHAQGDYLLFMDDDNVACEDMISTFAKAAVKSGANIVSAAFHVFSGDSAPCATTPVIEMYLPVGGIVSFSLVANAIGDANSLIERQTFNRLGGFTEDYGVGHEDFELYLRAALTGEPFCVIPKPLFWYRRNQGSMINTTPKLANSLRSFRPYLECLPAAYAELALMAHGAVQHRLRLTGWGDGLGASEMDTGADAVHLADPDSIGAAIAVCKVMLRRGQGAIAMQVLLDFFGTEDPNQDSTAGLMSKVQQFLIGPRQGSREEATWLIDDLQPFELTHRDALVDVLALLLLSLSHDAAQPDILRLFSDRLLQARPESVDVNLDVGVVLGRCGDHAVALQCFVKALALAEQHYVSQRPDVASAIASGQLPNGLIHYGRYGKREQAAWPSRQKFLEVAQELRSLTNAAVRGSPNVSSQEILGLVLQALR